MKEKIIKSILLLILLEYINLHLPIRAKTIKENRYNYEQIIH